MRCAKKSNPDWSVFAPVKVRIEKLLGDGKPRTVREVCDAIGSQSICHAREVLFGLVAQGKAETAKIKKGSHAVDCFRLAAPQRGLRPVPKTVPAKR